MKQVLCFLILLIGLQGVLAQSTGEEIEFTILRDKHSLTFILTGGGEIDFKGICIDVYLSNVEVETTCLKSYFSSLEIHPLKLPACLRIEWDNFNGAYPISCTNLTSGERRITKITESDIFWLDREITDYFDIDILQAETSIGFCNDDQVDDEVCELHFVPSVSPLNSVSAAPDDEVGPTVESSTEKLPTTVPNLGSLDLIYVETFANPGSVDTLRYPPRYPQHGRLDEGNEAVCDITKVGDFFDILPIPSVLQSHFYAQFDVIVDTSQDVAVGFGLGNFEEELYYLYLLDYTEQNEWLSELWYFPGTNPLTPIIDFPVEVPRWTPGVPFRLALQAADGTYTLYYSPNITGDLQVISEVDGRIMRPTSNQLGIAIWGSRFGARTVCIDNISIR